MDLSERSELSMLSHALSRAGRAGKSRGLLHMGRQGWGRGLGISGAGGGSGEGGGRIYWWIVWYFRPRALFLRQILLVSPMSVLLYTLLDVLNFGGAPCQFPER